jgi:hypothetical protein
MIKVRILTGVTAAGAAALAIPSLVGCGAPAAQDDSATGVGSDNNTESIAGSGQIILHGYTLDYQSTSGGDEFVRVGEKMKVVVDLSDVLGLMWPSDDDDKAALAAIKADPSKLTLTAKITRTKFDESKSDASYAVTFAPGAGGVLVGTSEELAIDKGVKVLSVDLVASYVKGAGTPVTRDLFQSQGIVRDFNVFGAFLPNKLALFDTAGGQERTRIVEGGGVVPGSQLTLAYTDWRCDTVVDKTSLDLRIGKQHTYSRFGSGIGDALGTLEYVVGAVVSSDGGKTFEPIELARVDHAEIFARADGYRYALQALKNIPGDANGEILVAFHIQAVLVVPPESSYYGSPPFDLKYPLGSRQTLRDTWDNNGGKNYSLPVGAD